MPVLAKTLGVLLLAFALASASLAATFRTERSVVFVNEVPVLKFLVRSGGVSPEERAARLTKLLESLPNSGQIVAKKTSKTEYALVSGKKTLLVVSPAEAKAQGKSARSLAYSWAQNLRSAFALPAVKVSESSLRIPVGSVKTISIVGSKAFYAVAMPTMEGVASVERTPGGAKIRGLAPGRVTIRIDSGGVMVPVDVDVRPYAATFPQTLSSYVTGSPATAGTVRGAVEGTIRTGLTAADHAKWRFDLERAYSLESGGTKTYQVRVWAEGPNAFDSSGLVTVVVRNLALPKQSDAELWYSNNPESVRMPGSLFSAPLKTGRAARLLYHHVNDATQPMYFRVQAVNDTDRAAKMIVIPGDSDPDKNPVRAGLKAANQYVQNWLPGSGEIITIPARSTLPISLRRVAPGETMSGLCTLRMVEGPEEILVRADAWPPFPLDARWQSALTTSTPWREVGTNPVNEFDRAPFSTSQYIYPNPYREEHVEYEVGGRHGFVRIGQKPIASHDQAGALSGNFGVIYNITAKVQNPTLEPTDVEVVFEASAGYSGGLFVVNGKLVQTPLLQPKEESRLTRVRLEPGSRSTIDIMTVPLSGSSYPVTLTIRPVLAFRGE